MNKHVAELLEKHFDTAFAAPDGINKLRQLILTLAMQGKLVPQDPNDQPASELLKEIETEKQRLVKEGKIREAKPLPPVSSVEKPYALPQGWEWVRLGEITDIIRGITFPASEKTKEPANGRIACLRTANVQKEIEWDDLLYIDRTFMSKNSQLVQRDDIVMSMANSRELVGKVAIVSEMPVDEATFGGFLGVLRTRKIAPLYVLHLLNTTYARSSLIDAASQTTNIANISLGKLNPFLVPLPPFAEQRRIVSKIDELMARCDELEKLRTAQQEACLTVHTTAIKQLLNIADPDQHQHAQAFLAKHFGELYTVKENVAELRKAILQLAMMGKLVPQNPNDPPANELLREIEAEKRQLMKEGKLKSRPPVTEKEKPYVLPRGWAWVRVWDIAELITSGSRDWAKYYSESGAKFITMGNLARGSYHLRTGAIRYVSPPADGEGSRTKLQENDLLVSITGDVGNLGLVPKNFGEAYINQHTCLLRFMPLCRNRYFPELMRSPFAKEQFDAPQRGIKNSFRLSDVGEMIVPLPPLPEQHRIVEKIDELMIMCNSLEHLIDEATQKHVELLNGLARTQSQKIYEKNQTIAGSHKKEIEVIDLTSYRAAIGCYLVEKLANAQYFGRTAAAKVMYLAQAHVGLALNLRPEREAAGPLDTWIYDFERQGQSQRWFEVKEKALASGRKKAEYRCLSALSEPVAKAEALISPDKKAEFDRLIYTLADKKTEEIEIIATLFAVWNDFLIDGIQPTDEQIISDVRENWHERKERFSPAELGRWLDWLRRENIIPRGLPPRTVQQPTLEFD